MSKATNPAPGVSQRAPYLFNSMGRSLEQFQPIIPGFVRLYSCGLTVYNYAHIGNLRAYLFTDTLRRALQFKGYEVLHVMNITDVGHMTSDQDEGEDKMELASAKSAKSPWELSEFYTQEFRKDLHRLNIMPPSVWCKATDHIEEMLDFAKVIDDRGYTYLLDSGLYFDTSKVKDYGRLALIDGKDLQVGARIEAIPGKRHPADFAIWRCSPAGKQRLMEWDSPWGPGAPGWHLECSVMSLKYLSHHFDIHTGGVDHRQVHHVNEIAQNQAFLNSDSSGVNVWMHNEFLMLEEEKMSKSSGHFLRLESLIENRFHPISYRYFTLMASYRKQLQFSMGSLAAAQKGLQRILRSIAQLKDKAGHQDWYRALEETKFSRGASFRVVRQMLEQGLASDLNRADDLDEALSEDLNTPRALALLSGLFSDTAMPAAMVLRNVALFDLALGLNLLSTAPEELLVQEEPGIPEADIEKLIEERNSARKNRDFRRADEIRQELLKVGIQLKDTPQRTTWERVAKPPSGNGE
jgi:cysteinyl-tRNA synthetase